MSQKLSAWIQAIRLRTLPLAASPIIVGGAMGFASGKGHIWILILALLTAWSFQILSNVANDYGDGLKGTDGEHRIGPKRTLQSGLLTKKELYNGMIILLILSLILASITLYLAFLPDEPRFFLMFMGLGMMSVVAATTYTVGRFSYGYYRLGDLFVFLFFGWLGVLGSKFLFTREIMAIDLLPASAIGCFSVAVLNLNNLRDMKGDKMAGKKTIANLLGWKWGKIYQMALMNLPFFLMLIYVLKTYPAAANQWEWQRFLFVLLMLVATPIRREILLAKEPRELDPYLKKVAILTLAFSIAVAYGLLI